MFASQSSQTFHPVFLVFLHRQPAAPHEHASLLLPCVYELSLQLLIVLVIHTWPEQELGCENGAGDLPDQSVTHFGFSEKE